MKKIKICRSIQTNKTLNNEQQFYCCMKKLKDGGHGRAGGPRFGRKPVLNCFRIVKSENFMTNSSCSYITPFSSLLLLLLLSIITIIIDLSITLLKDLSVSVCFF